LVKNQKPKTKNRRKDTSKKKTSEDIGGIGKMAKIKYDAPILTLIFTKDVFDWLL
jgi:hypothetical protein